VDVFGKKFRRPRACAALCVLATSIVISLLPEVVFAKADLAIGANFRSYPLSAFLEFESGYGLPLWGRPQAPLSGYVRPRVIWSTAATYNSLDGALEVFPLAFLGARAGGEVIQNDLLFSAYPCKTYSCVGRFTRTYFESELTLGAKRIFTQVRWRRERWNQRDQERGDFIDPTSGLIMRAGGDWQTVYFGILGVRWSPKWSTLLILRNAESGHQTFSRFPFLLFRHSQKNTTWGVGGGVFESELKTGGFALMALWRKEISASLGLR